MKILIRMIPVFLLGILIFFKNEIQFYDLFIFSVIIINLILSYPRLLSNYTNNYYSLINYFTWSFFILTIFYLKGLNLDYIVLLILMFKILMLLLNYVKFHNFHLTNTLLNTIWTFSFVLYLSELILNSTHTTKNIFVVLGLFSGVEMFMILIFLKEWKPNVFSIFSLLKSKIR